MSVLPALEVQDIIINSAQNILQLRDINLARAEEEACREVVKRILNSIRPAEGGDGATCPRACDARGAAYPGFAFVLAAIQG